MPHIPPPITAMDSLLQELRKIDEESEQRRSAYIERIRLIQREENARRIQPELWTGPVPTTVSGLKMGHDDEYVIAQRRESNTYRYTTNYLNSFLATDRAVMGGGGRRIPNDYAEIIRWANDMHSVSIEAILDKYSSKGCLFEQLTQAEKKIKDMQAKLKEKNEEIRELRYESSEMKKELKEANATIDTLKQMIEA